MEYLKLYQDYAVDSTMVPNCFIDKYMKDANDAQLKVYLYLLRVMRANLPVSISDIADKFNHTEREVMRALKYWEKQGLLTLEYDADKSLSGIHLCELKHPHEYNVIVSAPTRNAESFAEQPAVSPTEQPVLPSGQTAGSPEPPMYVKPAYTADDIRAFRKQENVGQLLYVAEQYVGKPLTPGDMKTILFFSDVLHFSDDLIDHLIQYCVEHGKKDFRYMEKVAVSWAEKGITTPDQAQAEALKYDKSVYAIMNALGKSGAPAVKELEYITRWTREYGFTQDIIFEACDRTVLATDRHRFEYAEKILSDWKRENVHHKADITRIDKLDQTRKTATPKRSVSTNRFTQINQHDYNFDELEEKLLKH